MYFEDLIGNLTNSKEGELPGIETQIKMSPANRKAADRLKPNGDDFKESAVLINLYPNDDGDAMMCLIKRVAYEGVHSDQVSLPGGRKEVGESLQETALREANEEVGILPNKVNIIRPLSSLFIPPSKFMVYPYLGYTESRPEFELDPREVANLIEIGVSDLFKEERKGIKKVPIANGLKITTPVYNLKNDFIWGATAMILREFEELFSSFRQP